MPEMGWNSKVNESVSKTATQTAYSRWIDVWCWDNTRDWIRAKALMTRRGRDALWTGSTHEMRSLLRMRGDDSTRLEGEPPGERGAIVMPCQERHAMPRAPPGRRFATHRVDKLRRRAEVSPSSASSLSLYVVELKSSSRTRLARYSPTRRLPSS